MVVARSAFEPVIEAGSDVLIVEACAVQADRFLTRIDDLSVNAIVIVVPIADKIVLGHNDAAVI